LKQTTISRYSFVGLTATACLAALILAGCIPVVSHEYSIEGQGDKSASGGCSLTTETLLTTHLTPDSSVVFWGPVERLHPSRRILSISFVFSNDEAALLTKPEVLVSSKSNAIPRAVPISTVRRSSKLRSPSCDAPEDSAYQPPSELMHRMPGNLDGESVTDSVFSIYIVLSGAPGQIKVELPPVSIDGKLVDIPAVTFVRKANVYLPAQIM
jgi:hypothetical protein